MKHLFKKLLQYYLKYITKLVLLIHRPTIIAVAGSTNKTFVKQEIVKILKNKKINVRANPKNFNTEIGLPLAILYLSSGYSSYKKWLPIIFRAFLAIWQRRFPDYLVLELGISDPGDMKYLLSIIKPKISVITDITQRYLESFSDIDELAGEYKILVKKTKRNGLVIMNHGNIKVREISKYALAEIVFFGIDKGTDWQVIKTEQKKSGQKIIVKYNNIIKEYTVNRFGAHHLNSKLVSLIIKDYVLEKEKKK